MRASGPTAVPVGPLGCFLGVIDERRQVPAPTASAWMCDLTEARGPVFVVLRANDLEARAALAVHLVEAEAVSSAEEAAGLISDCSPEAVAVVW